MFCVHRGGPNLHRLSVAGSGMKLIRNSGNDRVVDELRKSLVAGGTFDVASPAFSLFAFAELRGGSCAECVV